MVQERIFWENLLWLKPSVKIFQEYGGEEEQWSKVWLR
jgi:hypothetical protein